jgi:hypothetical protein
VELQEKEDDKVFFEFREISSFVSYFCINQSFVFPAHLLNEKQIVIHIFYCHT